jgi:hypothetical protein
MGKFLDFLSYSTQGGHFPVHAANTSLLPPKVVCINVCPDSMPRSLFTVLFSECIKLVVEGIEFSPLQYK